MSRIIVGVDGSERSEDAVAFGRLVARASGAPVTVASAYTYDHLAARDPSDEYGSFLRREVETVLEDLSGPLSDLPSLETRAVTDGSPARALQEIALDRDAGLIVVGSSHTGRLGRVLPGSTAERLLHGSPCPVAVVPRGYRSAPAHRTGMIACAWDERPESEAALAAAEDLAHGLSASLRVVRVLEPEKRVYPSELGSRYGEVIENVRETARRALDRRVSHLAGSLSGEGELHEGDAANELIAVSAQVDLLVIGSRGYGPLRAVLLGGVSGRVIRSAACPVIAIPNGAGSTLGSIFRRAGAR